MPDTMLQDGKAVGDMFKTWRDSLGGTGNLSTVPLRSELPARRIGKQTWFAPLDKSKDPRLSSLICDGLLHLDPSTLRCKDGDLGFKLEGSPCNHGAAWHTHAAVKQHWHGGR